jgi:hypothetical protein
MFSSKTKFVTNRNEFILFTISNILCAGKSNDGGGGGIRTPARLSTPLGFQDRPLQPDLGTPPIDRY